MAAAKVHHWATDTFKKSLCNEIMSLCNLARKL